MAFELTIHLSIMCDSPVRASKKTHYPPTLTIEATSACNLKCIMCALTQKRSSTSHSRIFFSEKIWNTLVSEIGGKVNNVIFTGFGEPTLHRHFHTMLSDLDNLTIRSSFSTNGIMIGDSLLETLLGLQHLTHVNVSIDSPDSEIYKNIRGGNLNRVLKNLGQLAAASGKFLLTVSSVAMRGTVDTLKSFPPILAQLGIRHYVVQSLYDQSQDGIGEDLHEKATADRAIRDIQAAAAENEIQLHFEHPERISVETSDDKRNLHEYFSNTRTNDAFVKRSRACMLPWTSAHIDASGSVFPCCRASAENKSKLGDLQQETLGEIWNGPEYYEFRNSLLLKEGRSCPDVCSGCTCVPAGIPPVEKFEAQIISVMARGNTVEVVARNIGTQEWSAELRPLLGTAEPMDRHSAAVDTSWISPNRAARPRENVVRTGELSHYTFTLTAIPEPTPEAFQFVVDGVLWLPNTRFTVQPPGMHAGGRYCTAGASYFVIVPTGDVFRCMTDVMAAAPPLFNVRDGWKPHSRITSCTHHDCASHCDRDQASKWTFDDAGQVTGADAQNYFGPGIVDTPDFNRLGQLVPNIIWLPTMICNYNCCYCGCGKDKKSVFAEMPQSNLELTTTDWLVAWAKIMESVDYASVSISGGEPMLSEATLPLIDLLPKQYFVSMTTNLSRDVMSLVRGAYTRPHHRHHPRYGQVTAGVGRIAASLHPTANGFHWERFKGRVLYLKNSGFNLQVNFVGHPTQLYLAPEYSDWCSENGVDFALLPWVGQDNLGYSA
jgi:MoaA/NifB/PqqE/SkfB family radical SAM enzyme